MPLKSGYRHKQGYNIPKSKSKNKKKLDKLAKIYVSCRKSKKYHKDTKKNKSICARIAHSKTKI